MKTALNVFLWPIGFWAVAGAIHTAKQGAAELPERFRATPWVFIVVLVVNFIAVTIVVAQAVF